MKTTIAIADDHDLFRNALKGILNHYFDVIVNATGGQDLLERLSLSYQIPDVVILDMSMHGMDGYTTLVNLKKIFPSIKVIIYTMRGEKELIEKMQSAGAEEYLLKGESLTVLIETIKRLTGSNIEIRKELKREMLSTVS